MKPPELGSAPTEEKFRANMLTLARMIDDLFNGERHGADREVGFVLLVFPYGESESSCNYISNGADRRDVIKLLREQANRFEEVQ